MSSHHEIVGTGTSMKHGKTMNQVEKMRMLEYFLMAEQTHEAHQESKRTRHIHMHRQAKAKTVEEPEHFSMQR